MSSEENDASLIEAGEMQSTEEKMRRALGLDGGGSSRPMGDKSAPRHGERSLHLPSGPMSNGSLSSGHVPSGGPSERRKHRFVQDGEIQYTVERRRGWTPGTAGGSPSGLTARSNGGGSPAAESAATSAVEALQATLRIEQATRERMERLLREAQVKIHDLQTNIGHAALARAEAQQEAVSALAKIEALEAALSESQSDLAKAIAARDAAIQARKDLADQLAEAQAARETAERAVQDAVTTRLTVDVVREAVKAPRKTAAVAKPRTKVKEPQPVKWWIKSKTPTKTK